MSKRCSETDYVAFRQNTVEFKILSFTENWASIVKRYIRYHFFFILIWSKAVLTVYAWHWNGWKCYATFIIFSCLWPLTDFLNLLLNKEIGHARVCLSIYLFGCFIHTIVIFSRGISLRDNKGYFFKYL